MGAVSSGGFGRQALNRGCGAMVGQARRLASVNERDWLVDAFVWINRQLTGRRRAGTSR